MTQQSQTLRLIRGTYCTGWPVPLWSWHTLERVAGEAAYRATVKFITGGILHHTQRPPAANDRVCLR